MKENMGTVILTNMGMTGSAPGWILPKSMHLTILFDHDAVDGAPAAVFTDKLIRKIQGAEEI